MAATGNVLAFDLGAESGRAILGRFDGSIVRMEVIHRFTNGPVRVLGQLYWDALRLFEEIQQGMRLAGQRASLDAVGIDTWGVDFALLGRHDILLGNPRHYRDPHTENIMAETFRRVPKEQIFHCTGIQFMRFNSLFQLLALQRDHSPLLEAARSLLFMPDLFHFWMTGVKANELSIASTSQFYDPVARTWAYSLFEQLGLPKAILGDILMPGTRLGTLVPAVAEATGLGRVSVILPATHDTASAVAAVPARGQDWCYLSSGTWSLMGIEVQTPIIDDRSLQHNFTNEVGVDGTIRFLKNIMGLWLVQECRRSWQRQGHDYSYEELTRLAEQSPPFRSLIDPDHPDFLLPEDMPQAIARYCERTGQPVPQQPGDYIRCCLDSLALRYRWVLDKLEAMRGRRVEVIHIVGGGSNNRLLNQLTADACDRLVLAGPAEATALGNILVQGIGLGYFSSLAQARDVVARSCSPKRFEPQQPEAWTEPYRRFCKLLSG